MTSKRRGLGRGLDALLGASAGTHVASVAADGQLRELPLDLIERGRFQPRMHIAPEALEELTRSIRARGVVQPIVVRPAADGARFEIIAGERRWRAAQAAGLAEIPAVVREVPDDAALAIALIENIQREDLNPIEEASAVSRLIEEFSLTHQEAADAIGRSRQAVDGTPAAQVPPHLRSAVHEGQKALGDAVDRAVGCALQRALQYPIAVQIEVQVDVHVEEVEVEGAEEHQGPVDEHHPQRDREEHGGDGEDGMEEGVHVLFGLRRGTRGA